MLNIIIVPSSTFGFGELDRIFITAIKYLKINLLSNWSFIDVFRIIRNSFLILVNGYSPLIPFIGLSIKNGRK